MCSRMADEGGGGGKIGRAYMVLHPLARDFIYVIPSKAYVLFLLHMIYSSFWGIHHIVYGFSG
jgi:hypothetical protein